MTGIASFTSGEITVKRDDDGIRIRYSLGIWQSIEALVMLVPSGLLLAGAGFSLRTALYFIAITEVLMLGKIYLTCVNIGSWFRAVVTSALTESS